MCVLLNNVLGLFAFVHYNYSSFTVSSLKRHFKIKFHRFSLILLFTVTLIIESDFGIGPTHLLASNDSTCYNRSLWKCLGRMSEQSKLNLSNKIEHKLLLRNKSDEESGIIEGWGGWSCLGLKTVVGEGVSSIDAVSRWMDGSKGLWDWERLVELGFRWC